MYVCRYAYTAVASIHVCKYLRVCVIYTFAHTNSKCRYTKESALLSAVCGSVLWCVAVCCGVLRCVAVCCGVLRCVEVRRSASQCVAVSRKYHHSHLLKKLPRRVVTPIRCVWQSVCCGVLQCIAVHCSVKKTPPLPLS